MEEEIHKKDRKVMEKLYDRALNKAKKDGFRRWVNKKLIVDEFMRFEVAVIALKGHIEANKETVNLIYRTLMNIEKVCRLMDKEGIPASDIRLMRDGCIW